LLSRPAFLLAAAAMLLTVALPLAMRHQHEAAYAAAMVSSAPAHSIESDEALLEGIDRDLSASVPAPMQSLADPTASATTASTTTSVSTPAQRND